MIGTLIILGCLAVCYLIFVLYSPRKVSPYGIRMPEFDFQWIEQTPEEIANYQHNFQQWAALVQKALVKFNCSIKLDERRLAVPWEYEWATIRTMLYAETGRYFFSCLSDLRNTSIDIRLEVNRPEYNAERLCMGGLFDYIDTRMSSSKSASMEFIRSDALMNGKKLVTAETIESLLNSDDECGALLQAYNEKPYVYTGKTWRPLKTAHGIFSLHREGLPFPGLCVLDDLDDPFYRVIYYVDLHKGIQSKILDAGFNPIKVPLGSLLEETLVEYIKQKNLADHQLDLTLYDMEMAFDGKGGFNRIENKPLMELYQQTV